MEKVLYKPNDLILPERFVQEHKSGMVNSFKQSLEKVINENQWRDEPYFISYHENDDAFKPNLVRGKFDVSVDLPIRWARQIVYWVDNKKGFKEWLWTVDDLRKTYCNVEGIQKAKKSGALVPKK